MKIWTFKIFITRSNAQNFWVLLFFFIFLYANAQDSIAVRNHFIDSQVKNQVLKYPVNFTNQNIKDFTFTQVSFEKQNNEFARTQVAEEINTYEFSAQGYYTTSSKWNFFGDLSIEKEEEKNIGWVLSEDRAEEQEVIMPHYFFVPRKGNWLNQRYRLRGGFSKNITHHITAAVIGNYVAEKFSRNLDPRPQIAKRILGGEIQLGYQFIQNHKLFAIAEYFENQKDYDIKYNDGSLNFEAYPETYLRFNAGYGRILNSIKSKSVNLFMHVESNDKLGLGYSFFNKKITFTALFYKLHSNNILYNNNLPLKENERFKIETKKNHFELFLLHKWNQKEIQSILTLDYSEAKNYDVSSFGYNYTNSLNALNWQTSIARKTKTHIDYLFGFNVLYQQNEYNDVMATTAIEVNSLNTGIFGSKDFSFTKSKLNAVIGLNMYFPIPSKIEYYDTSGGSSVRFFNEVILHDYAVSTTNYFAPSLRFEYSYPVKNNKTIVFFTNLKEKIALKKQSDFYADLNTNTTYWMQIGIQLNY